ncbi:uncharacterized protein LOC106157545 [Lingula anatina]|uniref:Uncharacterized protein LOC106157545 n=1 Tax=Lingula anatina TaxID=7574 RepID=A0A1S3HRM0_LINAN|nr:uncharacterized protein LOC106157545 [Lingula anatina]|eukprot:XP_013388678.1 uncharacterized protein LOC106157545 [Lingula anatina]
MILRDQSFIALIKVKQGEKEKVMDMLQKILERDPELDGRPGEVDSNTLNHVASALFLTGKHKEALLLYSRSLMIAQPALGEHLNTALILKRIGECPLIIAQPALEEHINTAAILKRIGVCKLCLGDADGAANAFQGALAFTEKIFGGHHKFTAAMIHDLACAMSAQGNHAEALSTFQRALRMKEDVLGESASTAHTLYKIGHEMLTISDPAGAVKSIQRAVAIMEKIHGDHHESTADMIHNLACAMSAQGNYAEALLTFQRALRIKEDLLGESASTSLTLYEIGQNMLTMSDPAGAEKSFQRALDIRENIHGEHHTITADTIHELARAMSAQGNHAGALRTFQRALRIKENLLGESASTSLTLYKIGHEMLIMSDPAGAEKSFHRALSIREKIHGEHHESTAVAINALGGAMSIQGNHVEALSSLQRALRITEEVWGESANTATALCNIGVVMLNMDDVDGAVNAFQRALTINEKTHGEHHESTANTIHLLARAMSAQGKHVEALSTYQRAFRVMDEVLGESASTACTLRNIGQEMLTLEDADGAVNAFKIALAMEEKIHGEHHESTANTIHQLARAMSAQGKHVEALSAYQRAIRIKEEVLGESESTVKKLYTIGQEMLNTAHTVQSEGSDEIKTDYIESAVYVFRKAVEIRKKTLGECHSLTVVTTHALGRALFEQGHFSESLNICLKVLLIREQEGLIEDRDTVVIMGNIAVVMKATEDTDGAITMYRRALDLSRRVLGDDEQTMDLQNDLSEILQEVGRVEESATLRKEAEILKKRLAASKTKSNGS